MRNTNKKGFTIVELVIVVAVIAILAAVLIPTFSSIIKKANIASDTAVAKNLNTAAISASANNFDAAIEAVREAGYLVANLNAKADGCYFVWEDDSNQFLLYDLKNEKILYSNTEVSGDPDASWCFAVNNSTDESNVKSALANVTTKLAPSSVADFMEIVNKGGNQTIYLDESVELEQGLEIIGSGNEITLNLGNSSLRTKAGASGFPIYAFDGSKVTIIGGEIGGTGEVVNQYGKFNNAVVCESADIVLDGTTMNIDGNATFVQDGNFTVKNCSITAKTHAINSAHWANITLVNTKAHSKTMAAIFISSNNATEGCAKLTIESGEYSSDAASRGSVYLYSGEITIVDGTFHATDDGKIFMVTGADNYSASGGSASNTITITGGTFEVNGTMKSFDKMTADDWATITIGTVSGAGTSTVVITK